MLIVWFGILVAICESIIGVGLVLLVGVISKPLLESDAAMIILSVFSLIVAIPVAVLIGERLSRSGKSKPLDGRANA